MKLTIPSPCSESWQQMNAVGENRFCNSCQKTVIDFSQKSDKEIIDHLKNANGKVCGRFNTAQLNNNLVYSYKTPFRFKRAASVLLATFTFSGISYAQQTQQKDESGLTEKKQETIVPEKKPAGPITIRGTVVDKTTQELIPFASIVVNGTQTGATSDIDGNFELKIKDTTANSFILKIAYVGYLPMEIPVNTKNQVTDLGQIKLEGNYHLQGELVIIQPKKSFFKRIFGRKK